MMTTSVISLALVLFLVHLTFLSGEPVFPYHKCFRGVGTYQNNSPYQTNLNTLLSTITSNDYGFYSSEYGQGADMVHARGLCRGDVNQTTCQNCLNGAKTALPTVCPNQKEAFGYSDFCTLHYASRQLSGYLNPEIGYGFNNRENATEKGAFTSALNDLMQTLKSEAASGDSNLKLSVGGKTADESETVYGLAQCSPDLSVTDCNACLDRAISDIPLYCKNKIGGRVIKLSCNLRFETVHFYYDT